MMLDVDAKAIEEVQKAWPQGISYADFRARVDALVEEGATTGPNQSEAMIHYTQLNHKRMQKWDKRFEPRQDLVERLQSENPTQKWLILTEAWCGDAAHSVPMLARLAQESGKVELRLVLRDAHPDLMDHFLTRGGRSIPKLICLNEDLSQVLATWGPRPQEAQALMDRLKKAEESGQEVMRQLQLWYAKDRGAQLQEELLKLF